MTGKSVIKSLVYHVNTSSPIKPRVCRWLWWWHGGIGWSLSGVLLSSSHGLCLEWAVNLQTQVFVSSPDIWFYSSNKTPPPLPQLSLSLKSVLFVQAQVSFSKYYVY